MDIRCTYVGTTVINYGLIIEGSGSPLNTFAGDFPTWVADSDGSDADSNGDTYYFNHMASVTGPLLGTWQSQYVGAGYGIAGALNWPEHVSFLRQTGPIVFGWLDIADSSQSLERVELQAFGGGFTLSGGNTAPSLSVSVGCGIRANFKPEITATARSATAAAPSSGSPGRPSWMEMHSTMFVIVCPSGQYRFFIATPRFLSAGTWNPVVTEFEDLHKTVTYTTTAVSDADYVLVGSWNAYSTFSTMTQQGVSQLIHFGGGPVVPALDVTQSKLVTLFNPELSDLNDLASVLWTQLFNMNDAITNIKKVFSDPMDLLISLITVPVNPDTEEDKTVVNFGGITFGDAVAMRRVTAQYKEVDFGTINIPASTGTYLDYSPYTRVTLYLPYIGGVQLNADWVVGKPLHLKYTIDVATGDCIAQAWVDGYAMYQYSGNCATHVPLTANNHSRQLAAGAAALSAALPAIAPMGGAVAGAIKATGSGLADLAGAMSVPTGHVATPGELFDEATAAASLAGGIQIPAAGPIGLPPVGAMATGAVIGGKPQVSISGAIGGSSGAMMEQTPYVVVEYPRLDVPENMKHYSGYPCNKRKAVSDCSGFTVFSEINLTSIPCTDEERKTIESFMLGGFYAN